MSNRSEILDDKDFWMRLEYDSSGWLQASDQKSLSRFSIDGFVPTTFVNTKRGIDIQGIAWILGDRDHGQYQFIVSVPQKLLHSKERTFSIESLSFDELKQFLHIAIKYEARVE